MPFEQRNSAQGGNYYYTDGKVVVPQKDEVKELVLYDITEQQVKKMELAEEINISHLAAGAYLLKGVKGNKTETLLLRIWKK
jgi:hypothetical protein